MKLFPFLGRSKNLIELFFIIGYDDNELSKCEKNNFENEKDLEITLISDIISDLAFESINIEDMISQIYPDKPSIIKNIKNGTGKPNPTSVVYSYFFDTTFYSCYAFKFYEKFNTSESEYFIPKAFGIISEYPYFTIFHLICSQLFKMKIESKNSFNTIEVANDINNIPTEIFMHCLVNYIPSPLNNNISLNIFPEHEIIIPKLTGYPHVNFDICYLLFNKDKRVKIKNLIKVYILMFLEIDLLFFSSEHEKLNLIMLLLVDLNYPLLDSEYSNHIKSISEKKLSKGFDIINTTFRGVITNFNWNLNLSNFRNLNYIVDVENKLEVINLGNEEGNKDLEDIQKLFEYLNKIFKYKDVPSSFLLNYINILRKELKQIRYEYKKLKISNNSFFNINEEIIKYNKKIQEAFYNFNLNILKIFYNYYKLDASNFEITNNRNINNNNYSEEEILFLKTFTDTTRYSKYYESFVKNFESVDELRLSFLFSDNYITNLKMKTNKFDRINNYFEIMDKLYINQNNKNENDKNCVIDYNYLFGDFDQFYQERIKQKILKIKTSSKNKLFRLNKKILNEFLFYKNNKELFKSLKEKEKDRVEFKIINKMFIPKIIEFYYINQEINNEEAINNNEINNEYLIICSFIFIFSFVFPLFSNSFINNFLKNDLIKTLEKIEFFQRYYIELILKSIYYYYLFNEKRGMLPDLTLENIKNYYNIILNELIIKNSILPNEDILFFLKNILHNENEKKQKPEKNNFIFQYDKVLEEENIIKENSIRKDEKNNSLFFTYDDGKEKNYPLISKEIDIHTKLYLIYKEFSKNNFDIEKFEFKKLYIIVNAFYFIKTKYNNNELSLFLYKSISILKKFELELKKYKKKTNK